jgi:hypothetical protein
MPPLRSLGWWAVLGASFVLGLAALVRLADPGGEPDHLTGAIRLPQVVTWTIASLFSVAALVMVVDVARRLRSRRHEDEDSMNFSRMAPPRPPWLQAVAQILSLVNFVVIGYLLWRNVLPFANFMGGVGATGGAGFEQAPPPDAPFFVTWTFAILGLLAGGGALALAVWITSSDRLAQWWEADDDEEAVPPPLVEAVDESLDDLRAESDARRAIIRSYARFERAAAAAGLRRRSAQTPMEFMRDALLRLPAPRSAVTALTALFELARFSDRALGDAERTRALDALDDIKAGMDKAALDAAR